MEKTISIVIVNYNVKDLLEKCLNSILESKGKFKLDLIVVDNNSEDGSIAYLRPKFPNVRYIQNSENLGFSKANNLGFKEAIGEYILILNPDTLIKSDTLQKMLGFMETNPDIGVAGCKVLNEDGTFQWACRRSFPTPWNSFTKLFGMQDFFPKSKLFASYNLKYLDINKEYDVDALIGAFMFCRKDIIYEVDGFDEDFFMYGEDLDLCFRIKKSGYRITYTPITEITHSKGESTKRSNINDAKHFYEAMRIYLRKNHPYSRVFISLINLGITFRSSINYLFRNKFDFILIFIDLLIILSSFLVSNLIRFDSIYGHPVDSFFFFSFLIGLVLFLSNFFTGLYFEQQRFSLSKLLQSSALFGIITGFITYLFQDLDLSRKVLLFTVLINFSLSGILRLILGRIYKRKEKSNILIIGNPELSNEIFNYITFQNNPNVGNVIVNSSLELAYINSFIKENNIDELILEKGTKTGIESSSKLNIIEISNLDEFKIESEIFSITGNRQVKGSILEFPRVRVYKRLLDILLSIIFLSIGLPFINFIHTKNKNRIFSLLKVLFGKYSFIGLRNLRREHIYKEGFISIADLSGDENEMIIQNLNRYYLNNFSLGLDLDIFFRAFRKSGK